MLTCVIPVYNGEPFITPALQCLVNQQRRPDRVVVIDNCSTDRTPAIVEGFKTQLPIEFRQNETTIGSAANLNRCLELAAETEYLHMLLADDLVKPRFYSTLLPQLESISGRGMAFSHYELIDRSGDLIESTLVQAAPSPTRRLTLNQFL